MVNGSFVSQFSNNGDFREEEESRGIRMRGTVRNCFSVVGPVIACSGRNETLPLRERGGGGEVEGRGVWIKKGRGKTRLAPFPFLLHSLPLLFSRLYSRNSQPDAGALADIPYISGHPFSNEK